MIRSTLLAPITLAAALAVTPLAAQQPVPQSQMTYADIVDLADKSPLVLRAKIRDQATVEPERSPGLAPGHVRLYVEAETTALIAGNVPVGESLRYLVDLPLDAKGKAPKLKKQDVVLFARTVPGRPAEMQLVEADPQFVGPLGGPDGFMLQASSPAVGAGARVDDLPATDYFGNALPASGPLDVGAHQVSIGTSTGDDPGERAGGMRAYPNPARGEVTLAFDQARAGTATVSVVDLLGRRVWTERRTLAAGPAEVRLALGALALPAGAYVLRVDRDGAAPLVQRIAVMGEGR